VNYYTSEDVLLGKGEQAECDMILLPGGHTNLRDFIRGYMIERRGAQLYIDE
jgi:hypothetical protein